MRPLTVCRVVVLDGVLLAATGRTLRSLRLGPPSGLGDVWHFYDVSYTLQVQLHKPHLVH